MLVVSFAINYPTCSASSSEHADDNVSHRWPLPPTPSSLTPMRFRDRVIYVKRDDQIHFHGVTASKLRKLHKLFVDRSLDDYDTVVSYGGAQSNAMLAIARLCDYRRKQFKYFTRPIPGHLGSTTGNFRRALDLNMVHVPVDHEQFRRVFVDTAPAVVAATVGQCLHQAPFYFIPQGAAFTAAEYGIRILAVEIREQIQQLRRQQRIAHKRPLLFLPCGTGTTAFYLQKHLADVARVVAVPVSGSESYLIKQMRWLHQSERQSQRQSQHLSQGEHSAPLFPNVLRPRLRASFADVRPEKLSIWQELCRAAGGEFDFDLIYAPKAWEEVMLAIEQGRIGANGEDIIYYHTGGLEGNVSMLDRFKRKGLLNSFASKH